MNGRSCPATRHSACLMSDVEKCHFDDQANVEKYLGAFQVSARELQ